MNIFEMGAFLGIFAGATAAYHFVSPYGVFLGVLAAAVAAVAGFFIGRLAGLLFLLPFEGAARLGRFLTTGRGPEPSLPLRRRPEPHDRNA